MKKFTFFIVLLLFNVHLFSQITITGKVTDAITGEPLPISTLQIEGTTIGTTTDFDGMYTINANSETDVIMVSFIGYLTQKIEIGTQRVINFNLEEDVANLQEVVVTALGIKREKKALGYAVQDIDGDELTQGGNQNVVSALSGKIAGVQITSSSGSVGGSAVIKIRGNNTFKGNTSPLFVVDGVPISNTTSTTNVDYGNAAADIDPESIETMSVLKGASATALYGSRGANGVILITTRKGTKRKGIGVNFSTSFAFDEVYILPAYQNDYGQGVYVSEYNWKKAIGDLVPGDDGYISYQEWAASKWSWSPDDRTDESWGARLDNQVETVQFDSPVDADGNRIPTEMISRPDNIKNFYETGMSFVNSIALSGGNETAQGRLLISHTKQNGTTPNTDQEKLNIGINTDVKMSERLKFEVSGNFNITSNDNLSYQGRTTKNPLYEFNNWFGRQVNMEYLKDHYLDYVVHSGNSDFAAGEKSRLNWMTGYKSYNNNVYWSLNMNLNARERRRLFGNFSTTYKIADGFDLVARVGTDNINESRKSNLHSDTKGILVSQMNPVNGSFTESNYRENETNADLMLNITKHLTNTLSLHSTVGANYRHSLVENMWIGVPNLVVPDFYSTSAADGSVLATSDKWEKVSNSLFVSANLGYNSYLYLDLTYRHDWSSTLPKENRSYGYPSSTLGFIFSEAFELESDFFTYGKVRASYAEVGDDTSPYSTEAYYTRYGSAPWINGTAGDANFYRLSSVYPSSDLRPERTSSFEFGGEFKFFKNRLGLDASYYHAVTKDQLMYVKLAPSNGYYSWKKNAGSILNKGIEIQLYATPVESKDFSWDIVLNYAKNSNIIQELDGDITELELSSFSSAAGYGVTMWASEGEEWGTLKGHVRKKDDNGNFLVDEDGYYIMTEETVKVGSVNPDFIGGISNTFSYKMFSLSALIDFRFGGAVYSSTKVQGQRTGILQNTVDNNQRVDGYIAEGVYVEGTTDDEGNDISGQTNTTVFDARKFWKTTRSYTDMGIIDGSFIKLREMNLSYKIPSSIVSKLRLQDAYISVFARNIALLYTHKSNDVHIDPEVAASGSVLDTGFESFNLAPARTIGAKLNINF